jgi:hypothetical protein
MELLKALFIVFYFTIIGIILKFIARVIGSKIFNFHQAFNSIRKKISKKSNK